VRRVSLLRLIAVFTWTGLSSLGGGRSAYFHDALVRRRGFIRHDEFVQDFTLSQVLPGPNFSNLAVALGYRLAGIAGGVWGLLAIVLPGAVILVGVARLYLHGAFGGSGAGAAGGGWRMPSTTSPWSSGPGGRSTGSWRPMAVPGPSVRRTAAWCSTSTSRCRCVPNLHGSTADSMPPARSRAGPAGRRCPIGRTPRA